MSAIGLLSYRLEEKNAHGVVENSFPEQDGTELRVLRLMKRNKAAIIESKKRIKAKQEPRKQGIKKKKKKDGGYAMKTHLEKTTKGTTRERIRENNKAYGVVDNSLP